MFFLSPIVLAFCVSQLTSLSHNPFSFCHFLAHIDLQLYISVVYGYLYLLFTTITEVYESVYHFSTGLAGLSYLGIGIGMFLGLGIFGATSDRTLKKYKEKHNGEDSPPEIRLQGLVVPSLCIPIGLFWYGWSADKQIHWIMPIIGTGWVGLGLIGIFVSFLPFPRLLLALSPPTTSDPSPMD